MAKTTFRRKFNNLGFRSPRWHIVNHFINSTKKLPDYILRRRFLHSKNQEPNWEK